LLRRFIEETVFESDTNAKRDFEILVNDGIKAIQNEQFKKSSFISKRNRLFHFDLLLTFQRLIHLYPTFLYIVLYHQK
jgi:isochorismate synthase